jgi:hypothetical protein
MHVMIEMIEMTETIEVAEIETVTEIAIATGIEMIKAAIGHRTHKIPN